MCGSRDALDKFLTSAPQRSIDQLADELRVIQAMPPVDRTSYSDIWSTVYISLRDLIIPTANQYNAWNGHPDIRTMPGAHLPDFASIINSCLPNKPLISERFNASASTYDTNSPVQGNMAVKLASLWHEHLPETPHDDIIEIGAGTGKFTTEMLRYVSPRHLTLYDITPLNPSLPGKHICEDGELAIRTISDDSIDAITSSATIQWFSSIPGFIHHCHRILHTGGQLVLSTFAPDHFHEISNNLPSPIHYFSVDQWHQLLDEKFHIDVISQDRITLHFDSPIDLLKHLRNTGVNALQPSVTAARNIIKQSLHTLTYKPLYIIATKL